MQVEEIEIDGGTCEALRWDMWGISLLIIKAGKGFVGCGYINPDVAERFGQAFAMVSGVSSFEDVLGAEVKRVSSAAAALGVRTGMTGREALELMF